MTGVVVRMLLPVPNGVDIESVYAATVCQQIRLALLALTIGSASEGVVQSLHNLLTWG